MGILKKAAAVLIAVMLIVSGFSFSENLIVSQAATVRTRKIVSVVYDDSGSMEAEKLYYTSYAMQCFAGMLNKEDILEITYMNSDSKSFNTADRQNNVDYIRQTASCNGGTPLQSVTTAMNKLKSYTNTDKNTQYWLVVITDGDFYRYDGSDDDNYPEKRLENTRKRISECAAETMPNGTSPQVVFFSICDENNEFTPDFSESNIRVKSAKTAANIIDEISSIACEISGRFELDKKDIDVVDSKTVKVTADVPLTNIGILTQKTKATVKSVKYEDSSEKDIECNVSVYIDPTAPIADAKDLTGNISIVSDKNGNLPTGDYVIEFSEDISAEDTVIMFEPAFELRIELYSGNQLVSDPSLLPVGEEIDIKAVLYETGTDNKILPSMLPKGTKYSLTRYEDSNNAGAADGFEMNAVVLRKAENKITASVDLPGYFTLEAVEIFTPINLHLSDLKAELQYDGSERRVNKDGTVDGENVVYITDLDKNGTGIRFTLYIDDKPVDKNQAQALLGAFEKSLETDFKNFSTAVNDDGTVVVYPSKTRVPALIYWLFHHGDSNIKSEYDSKSASGTVNFKIGDLKTAIIDFLKLLAVIALCLYLFCMIFLKKRFRPAIVCVRAAYSNGKPNPKYSDGAEFTINRLSFSGPLNLFFGMRAKVKIPDTSLRLVVGYTGDYMVENVKGMRVSTTTNYPGARDPECTQKRISFPSNIYINTGSGSYIHINVQ